MRIRQVKPSWWLDKELRKSTNADVREFYIGLWMVADDAGYFEWDPIRIAAELYPYAGVSQRERNVATWGQRLQEVQPDSPHLVLWTCGHGCVPKMPNHQRISGKQTMTVADKHRDNCTEKRRFVLGEPTLATDSPGRVGKGRERNGTARGLTIADDESMTETRAILERRGVFAGKAS